jgi:hypothetical protein
MQVSLERVQRQVETFQKVYEKPIEIKDVGETLDR